jgi:hypothetical protein
LPPEDGTLPPVGVGVIVQPDGTAPPATVTGLPLAATGAAHDGPLHAVIT